MTSHLSCRLLSHPDSSICDWTVVRCQTGNNTNSSRKTGRYHWHYIYYDRITHIQIKSENKEESAFSVSILYCDYLKSISIERQQYITHYGDTYSLTQAIMSSRAVSHHWTVGDRCRSLRMHRPITSRGSALEGIKVQNARVCVSGETGAKVGATVFFWYSSATQMYHTDVTNSNGLLCQAF